MEQEYWPSRKEVLELISSAWQPRVRTEEVAIEAAAGRIAAADVDAVHSLPVVRASSMDGIGVISAMFRDGVPDTSGWRPGVEYERADTGDDFGDRFDAVIPIEMVTLLPDGAVRLDPAVQVTAGCNIRPRGSYFREGDPIIRQWGTVTASDLAALAMGGVHNIAVVKKPVAAFIPTGSELIPAGQKPERGKNIDSNSPMVRQLLLEMGAEPLNYPIVRDDRAELERALDRALAAADVVILNGGSSKGGEDYNADLLKQRGRVLCHNVAAAPGRPMCIAIVDGKPVINVPGPSIACFYGMDWCVRAVVDALLRRAPVKRRTIPVRLSEDISYSKGMEILCKMEVWSTADGYAGRQAPFRGSTVIENLTAPGVFVTDPARDCHKAGEIVAVELLKEELEIGMTR